MRKLRPNERKQLILINGKPELKSSLLTPKLNVVYTLLVNTLIVQFNKQAVSLYFCTWLFSENMYVEQIELSYMASGNADGTATCKKLSIFF